MEPLFSIIIPIYKVESYIEQCIQSVLDQTYQMFELLLIDDGSPDKCPEICDKYQRSDKRIRVFHKKNEGLVKARETGLLAARGAFIGFVDGDDWVERDWLMKIADIISTYHPEVISYNVCLNYANKERRVPLTIRTGFYDKSLLEKQIYPIMLYARHQRFYNFGVYPSLANKMMKREILLDNRCKDPRITMGEDACCVYASLLNAESMYVTEDYLYHYRQNPDSMTNAYDKDRFLRYQYLLQYLEQRLKDQGYDLDRQLLYHQAFRAKHAVLNESKADGSVKMRAEQLGVKMVQYELADAFDGLTIEHMGAFTRIFVYLMKKRCYWALIIMCDIFNWLQKRR